MCGDTVVNFVYVGPLLPMTEDIAAIVHYCAPRYYQNAQIDSMLDWYEYVNYDVTEKRWVNFINSWDTEQYYFFIIQAELLKHWKEVLDKYNMKEWVVWKSRSPAVNANDPKSGPRLTAYILRKV